MLNFLYFIAGRFSKFARCHYFSTAWTFFEYGIDWILNSFTKHCFLFILHLYYWVSELYDVLFFLYLNINFSWWVGGWWYLSCISCYSFHYGLFFHCYTSGSVDLCVMLLVFFHGLYNLFVWLWLLKFYTVVRVQMNWHLNVIKTGN